MIKNQAQLDQAMDKIVLLYRAIESMRRKQAILEEGPLAQIKQLEMEVRRYLNESL